jgi:hypothetical protein
LSARREHPSRHQRPCRIRRATWVRGCAARMAQRRWRCGPAASGLISPPGNPAVTDPPRGQVTVVVESKRTERSSDVLDRARRPSGPARCPGGAGLRLQPAQGQYLGAAAISKARRPGPGRVGAADAGGARARRHRGDLSPSRDGGAVRRVLLRTCSRISRCATSGPRG